MRNIQWFGRPLHASFRVDGELLGGYDLPVLPSGKRDLPGAPGAERTFAFIHAIALIHGVTVRIAAIPIAGIAAIKKVTFTCAPVTGLPSELVSFTRNTLPPLCGGDGSVVRSIFACAAAGAFIAEHHPRRRNRGEAACKPLRQLVAGSPSRAESWPR